VRTEDFRIRRFARREGSTAIFLVDASGSAAFQRLAEAKGAVELLLARSYASRTEVALIAFRGEGAALLLAPTRSLTRARRRLADLPGGGATPLAAALEAGLQLALRERARGRTPSLVVLSDGRGNIARDGAPDRARAEAEALAMAQAIRAAGVAAALLDTAPRPRPENRVLAQAMGAAYAPLPYLAADRVVAALAAGGAGP
jgi:magnesium chelatase subunit D